MMKSKRLWGVSLLMLLIVLLNTGCAPSVTVLKGRVINPARQELSCLTDETKRQVVENNCKLDPLNCKLKGKHK